STVYCQYNLVLNEINLKNGNNTKLTNGDVALNGNPSLYCIQVDDVNYSTQNWINKDAYVDYTAAACTAPLYTLIPDAEFEKLLIQKGIDGVQDGKVLTNIIAKIKVLNLSNANTKYKIQDLTGIQDFEALEELKFPNNNEANIATVNLSKNQFLKKLDCRQSGITTLDVSKNTALTDLNCYGNKLTSLDVSKNSALTTLDCSYNRLTVLDVTNNINLKSLSCSSSNKEGVFSLQQGLLTSLDVSKNLALEFLDCSMNEKLVKLDVSKNSNLTSINVGYNNLTSVDFSANKLLKSLRCNNNQITSIDLSKYPALESIDCSSNQLTVLDVSQKTALKSLMCSNNQLLNIDVSKNTLLEFFYCDNNKLTTLDLSSNPKLKQLLCSSNSNLTKLNLKNGGNTNLDGKYQSIFSNNPNLLCILVDDVAYANKTWATYKDAIASYNTECGFSLPSKNFTVESKGESCLGENNGEISITASAQFPYVANINGKTGAFANNSLKVSNLTPGIYTIIVTIPGEVYEQTFTLSIAKGANITGKSTVNSKTVAVEITEGTAPFTVFVDGTEQFQTNEAEFSVEVSKNALVEVVTSKACEGIYAKKVSISDFESGTLSAYPNPTSGYFEIEIPTNKKEVKIEMYNFGGQLISDNNYIIENGKAQLHLENHPSGIYAAKIYLDTPEYIKIIKK
ncbi:MAG: leucine-rich repeat domain-containing protein, partial [Flavobacterium sp.]